AEDGIRDGHVTGVQTCALPISSPAPFAMTFTFPPPASTSIVLSASSACVLAICSCIFCACFINLFRFILSILPQDLIWPLNISRSEERRVGKECVCWLWCSVLL